MTDRALERACPSPVAGIDEAGRGPWAGPVVAAAVILGAAVPAGVTDSKRLSRDRREALFTALRASACIGVGVASVAEIDRLNILAATHLVMHRAGSRPDLLVTPVRGTVFGSRECIWEIPDKLL